MRPALVIKLLWVSVVCLASSASASATIMRCGDKGIIHVGDSRGKVLTECNEPTAAVERMELRTVRVFHHHACKRNKKKRRCVRFVDRIVAVQIDEWTYDFGKNRFVQHLTFENGRLVSIEHSGYSQSDE